jgi:hypothetical protein
MVNVVLTIFLMILYSDFLILLRINLGRPEDSVDDVYRATNIFFRVGV